MEQLRSSHTVKPFFRRQRQTLALAHAYRRAQRKVFPQTLAAQAAQVAAYLLTFSLLGIGDMLRVPYLAWMLCGIAPWFYFREAVFAAAQSLYDCAGLWRANACPVRSLPAAGVLSAFPTLLLWAAAALIAAAISGHLSPSAWYLPYYLLCAVINAMAQGLLAAAFAPFYPQFRVGMRISMFLTFWMTPIVWPATFLSELMRMFSRLNPLYYIIEGTRQSLLYGVAPAWNDTLWFFMLTFCLTVVGGICLTRLKKHYPEVMPSHAAE